MYSGYGRGNGARQGRFRGRCPVYSLSAPCGAGAGVAAPFDPTSVRPAHQASRFAGPDDGDPQTMHSTPDRPKRSYTLPERPWLPTWQRLATFTQKSAAEGDEAGAAVRLTLARDLVRLRAKPECPLVSWVSCARLHDRSRIQIVGWQRRIGLALWRQALRAPYELEELRLWQARGSWRWESRR